MNFKIFAGLVAAAGLMGATASPALAQDSWRTVAPENLLVLDTTKGRVVVELDPLVAPNHVERVRTLADRGFYDGLKFHRVLSGFMAQTGDPLGTGEGGSDLPDIAGEFTFRRGMANPFGQVAQAPRGLTGLVNSIPVLTQPNGQMMITADMKVAATPQFCPGVAGMARSSDPNSANSQFFLMTGVSEQLNGGYTAFGRVLAGLDVVRNLNAGPSSADGRVPNPDQITRARTADQLPEAERPAARVMTSNSPEFAALIEAKRAELGTRLTVCDIQPTAEVTGS